MSSPKDIYYEAKKPRTKWQKFMRAIWNSDRKEFLGRNAASWAKILIAYIIFYLFLAGFFAIMMVVFLRTLSRTRPRYILSDSIIGTNPGMGYRPHPDPEKTLIYFHPNKPNTYSPYIDDLNKFLKTYETSDQMEGEDFLNCNYQQKVRDEQICKVDIKDVSEGCDKSRDYGYKDGKPCVLLKLNKIYGWKPKPYAPNKIPTDVIASYDNRYVTIRCEGENAADQENIGEITYYPSPKGISYLAFPFLNQKGYQESFIMAKFNNPQRGILINVICKAYAGNIVHDKPNEESKLRGAVRFELLVD